MDIDDNVTYDDDEFNIDDELQKIASKLKKIRNTCVKNNSEIPMNKEYGHAFMRNKNYHYLAVAKLNTLLANKYNRGFVLTAFGIFNLIK